MNGHRRSSGPERCLTHGGEGRRNTHTKTCRHRVSAHTHRHTHVGRHAKQKYVPSCWMSRYVNKHTSSTDTPKTKTCKHTHTHIHRHTRRSKCVSNATRNAPEIVKRRRSRWPQIPKAKQQKPTSEQLNAVHDARRSHRSPSGEASQKLGLPMAGAAAEIAEGRS